MTFSAFLWISLKRLNGIFLKPHHIIFIMFIITSESFIKIVTPWNFKTNLSYEPAKNSAFQHSLFWRYANLSKLMPTIHASMNSTFQCEYCQCFTFKICNKIHTKLYSPWRYVWWASIWKNRHNVKTVNLVTRIFGRSVG